VAVSTLILDEYHDVCVLHLSRPLTVFAKPTDTVMVGSIIRLRPSLVRTLEGSAKIAAWSEMAVDVYDWEIEGAVRRAEVDARQWSRFIHIQLLMFGRLF
jgi:hypothetical protein